MNAKTANEIAGLFHGQDRLTKKQAQWLHSVASREAGIKLRDKAGRSVAEGHYEIDGCVYTWKMVGQPYGSALFFVDIYEEPKIDMEEQAQKSVVLALSRLMVSAPEQYINEQTRLNAHLQGGGNWQDFKVNSNEG